MLLAPLPLLGLLAAPPAALAQTDTTPPTLSSATVSEDVVTLTYDEPLDETSVPPSSAFAAKVNDTGVGVASTDPVVSGSTVVLRLFSPVSSGDTVALSYSPTTLPSEQIKDANGNAAAAFTDQSVTNNDKTPPALTGAVVDGTALTLTWHEALDTNSTPAASAFTVTVDGTTASLAASNPVTVSGMTVVLTLAEAVVSAGQEVTVSYAVPATNKIRDTAQNDADALTDEAVTVTDTTRPGLSSATVDGTTVTLTYDEKLDETSVPAKNAFVVTVDTAPENPQTVVVTGMTVLLTIQEAVASGATVTVDYDTALATNPIQDLADPANTAVALDDETVTFMDTTAPIFRDASVAGATLTLNYDEALDTTSVPAGSDFTVEVDGTEVSLAATDPVAVSGMTVTLTLDAAVSGATATVSYTPGTNPIQDAANNAAEALTNRAVSIVDMTAPTLSTASVNGTTLTLTYDEALDTGSQPAASAFTVTVDGTDATVSSVSVAGMTVVLTLAAAVDSAGQTATVSYAVPTSNPIQDPHDNDAAAFTDQTVMIEDDTAPTLTDATAVGATLTLTWSELLDESSRPSDLAFHVTIDGTETNPSAVEMGGSTIVLTLNTAPVSAGQGVTVSFTRVSGNHIRDRADPANNAANFSNRAVTVLEATAPMLTGATVEGAALTLTYDERLDEASVPAGSAFTVTVGGSEVSLAATDPVAVSDSTVVLTLAAAVSRGSTVTASYAVPATNQIQDRAVPANVAAAFTGESVSVVDTMAPTLSAATVEATTLTMTWNETLNEASVPAGSAFTVTAGGTTVGLAPSNPVAVAGMTVTLTLATAVSPGSTVTLAYAAPSSNPIEDLSDNAATNFTGRSVTHIDTTPPTLAFASVDGAVLSLTYNEPLNASSVPAASAFTVTVNGATVSLAATNPVMVSGSSVVLTLAAEVASGSTASVSYTPGTNPIEDPSDNAAAALTDQSVTVGDSEAPMLSAATVAGATLTLTYNEPLSGDYIPAASAFSVTVDSGTPANPSLVEIDGSAVVLTLAAAVSDTSTVTVSYTVPTIDPIQDGAGNSAAALTDEPVTSLDTTPPVLSDAAVEGTVLTLTYNEPLDTAPTPAAAFTVTVDTAEATVSAVEIAGSAVMLTLAAEVRFGSTVTLNYAVPTTNPVRDSASNPAAALTARSVTVLDTTAPMLSAATVEGTALTLTYSEPLDAASLPAPAAFTVTVDGTGANLSLVAIVDSTVVLTLAAAVSPDATVTLTYAVPGTNPIQDAAANAVAALTDEPVATVDTMAPMLTGATVEGTALTLTWDEPLDANSTPAGAAFTVTVDGTPTSPASVAVAGSTVTLTLASPVRFGAAVTLSYTAPAANPIQDAAANAAADVTDRAVTVLDMTPPMLLAATVAGSTLTLTWDEPLDTNSTPAGADFTVTVDGTGASPSTVEVIGASVVLTLAAEVSPGSTATLDYAVPATNPIRDMAGNAAAAVTGRAVTVGDSTAPTLPTAEAGGMTLTLTYNEPLDTDSVPAASAFTVTVDGTAANPSSVAVAGSEVTLTLAAAVNSGQTVTVSYTAPGTNPIRDPAGNAAASFTDRSVTVVSSDALLSALTLTGGGNPLTLTPAFSSSTYAYTAVADDSAAAAIVVTATVSDPGATLAGALSRAGGTAEDVAMTSGAATPLENLAAGGNVLTIAVTAQDGTMQSYTLTITQKAAPTVSIAGSRRVAPGMDLMLRAVASDPDGGDVTYAWSAAAAPANMGAAAVLSGADTEMLTFNAAEPGSWTVTVTVTDDENQTASASLRVTVAVDTEMREKAVTRVLAEAGLRTLSSALANVGARLGEAPGPSLTLAGENVPLGVGASASALACEPDIFGRNECAPDMRGASALDLLGSSAFSLAAGASGGAAADPAAPRWALWGRGDIGSFEGKPTGMSYEGKTRSGWLGADARASRWVAGVALSRGETETDYAFDADGEAGEGSLETTLTSVYPYGRVTVAEGFELRGVVGAGTGEARHRPKDAAAETSSLEMWMASAGIRQAFTPMAGFALALRGDVSVVRMSTGDGEETIDGLGAQGWRGRAGLEGSRRFALSGGSSVEPFAEAGIRQDGGDGLEGSGVEVAGGMRFGADRLHIEARGRWLAAHTEEGTEEHGVSVTARMAADGAGRGLSFALSPRWGSPATGSGALWQDDLPRPGDGAAAGTAVDARLGYGVGAGPGKLLTPFVETGVSDSENRRFRVGARYEALRALSLELSGERRERETAEPEHMLGLDVRLRF